MKLLMFVPSFRGGGAERVFVNLANYFFSKGIDVSYVVINDEGPNKELLSNGIKLINLDKKSVYLSLFAFSKLLLTEKPTVVFSTMMSCNIISLLSRSLTFTSSKAVIREANVIPNRDSFQDKVKDFIAKLIYSRADEIIVNSPDTKSDLVSLVGEKNSEKMVVIGNPVISKNTIDLRYNSKHGLTPSRKIKILSIGRLVKQKNYTLAIDVIKDLRSQGYDVELDIFGEGPLFDELHSYSISNNISESINFKGYVKDIDSLLPDYNVFLLTSLWEGFGNVIVEALSAGLPVVLTDCKGGPNFIVSDRDVGSICEFDKARLAKEIIEQHNTDSLRKIELRKKRALFFSIENSGDKYLSTLLGKDNI